MMASDSNVFLQVLESSSSRYICSLCPKSISFRESAAFELHLRQKHEENIKSTCPYCSFEIKITGFRKHIDRHFTFGIELPFVCPICNLQFITSTGLAQHANKCHKLFGATVFNKCGHCDQSINSISDLHQHLSDSSLFMHHCNYPRCMVKSINLEDVLKHWTTCHSDTRIDIHSDRSQPIKTSESDAPIFVFDSPCLFCPLCSFGTHELDVFARHLMGCKSEDSKQESSLSITCTLFRCTTCQWPSTVKEKLLDHINNEHPNQNATLSEEEFTVPRSEELANIIPQNNCALDTVLSALNGLASLSKLLPVDPNLLSTSTNFQPHVTAESNNCEISSDSVNNSKIAQTDITDPLANDNDDGRSTLDDGKSTEVPSITDDVPESDIARMDNSTTIVKEITESVRFRFDEEAFVSACSDKDADQDKLFQNIDMITVIERLRKLDKYRIPILGRTNQRRIAGCPECPKQFNHGFTDLKKHILVIHLGIRRDLARFSANFAHSIRDSFYHRNGSNRSITPSSNIDPHVYGAFHSSNRKSLMPQNRSNQSKPNIASLDNIPNGTTDLDPTPSATVSSNGLPTLVNNPTQSYTGSAPVHRVIPGTGVSDHQEDMRSFDEVIADAPTGRGGVIPLGDDGSPDPEAIVAALEPHGSSTEPSTDRFMPRYGRQHIQLAYSMPVFKRLLEAYQVPIAERIQLVNRMNHYTRMFVIMDVLVPSGAQKKFSCPNCMYTSIHSLADIRKHIMGSHCGISTKRFRLCLRASRHDTATYRLHSDDRMIRFIDDHRKRQLQSSHRSHGGNGIKNKETRNDYDGVDGFDDEDEESADLSIRPVASSRIGGKKQKNLSTIQRPDDLHHRIALPQEDVETEAIESGDPSVIEITHESSISSDTEFNRQASYEDDEDECDQRFITSFDRYPLSSRFSGAGPTSTPTQQSAEPPHRRSTGGDSSGDDSETHQPIRLPYSEPVLLTLIEREGLESQLADELVSKMSIYTNYKLTVVTRGNKIIAYICGCGRRFSVIREEMDSDIRPASLADCRRHILGVHARIPQELLTLCCQASRISKESGYRLYADHSLLALADQHKFRSHRIQSYGGGNKPDASSGRRSSSSDNRANPDETYSSYSGNGVSQVAMRHSNSSSLRPLPPMPRSLGGGVVKRNVSTFSHSDSPPPVCVKIGSKSTNKTTTTTDVNQDPGLDLEPPCRSLNASEASQWSHKLGLSPNWSLERIVRLQFSANIFRKLISPLIDEADPLFTTLLGRMVTYSRYSIYIVRILNSANVNQRNYVCCACLTSSHHGFGDIRKHILGVHNHIPERFKTAAMNASRLNREDYLIYSDAQLIQFTQSTRYKCNNNGLATMVSKPEPTRALRRRQSSELDASSSCSDRKRVKPDVDSDSSHVKTSNHYHSSPLTNGTGHSSPPPSNRPPIILTLPRPKCIPMHPDNNGSGDKRSSSGESGDSLLASSSKLEDLSDLDTPTSRSRRSMILKSKRPCPTTS